MGNKKNAGTLYSRTLALSKKSGITPIQIRDETGLPYHWIIKFTAGTIPDPSVNKVQKLYEYLTGDTLGV